MVWIDSCDTPDLKSVLAVIALASTGIAIITARRRKTNAPAHAA